MRKRLAYTLSAALVVSGFGICSAFAADTNTDNTGQTTNTNTGQTTGDNLRNAVDHAGAGAPTAANPAPDAKGIRTTLADVTEDGLTKGDMSTLVNNFVDADSNRIKKSPTADDNYGKEIDGRIEQISQAWKAKYGNDFHIKKVRNQVLEDQFASIQQGVIGNDADAQLASEVEKNSANANMTNQENNQGNTASDEKLENGRSIAVVTVAAEQNLPELKVPLIHELPDSWKVNVPDSMDANKLRQNLQDELTAIGTMSTEWPSDENQAYRVVAHRVLMAVLDVPGPSK
jgi:hypothetical protein